MHIYAVRLNPDPRNCKPYSKFPSSDEYEKIYKSSIMNGFHECANFMPIGGINYGYLPGYLKSLDNGPFVLISTTAKTAKNHGNEILGIQAGCRYIGKQIRQGMPQDLKDKGFEYHYSCPETMSLLLKKPIKDARDIIVTKHKYWGQGATFELSEKNDKKILNKIIELIQEQELNNAEQQKLKSIITFINSDDDSNNVGSLEQYYKELESKVSTARTLNLLDVKGVRHPKQIELQTYVYVRDEKVAAITLNKANGICGDCMEKAPFIRASDGTPYLEVHHIKPLSEGGEDIVNNTIALCPNCHRKRHYGITG